MSDKPILESRWNPQENDGLEEWEADVLDNADQPELYDTLDIVMLRQAINKVAVASIIIYILLGLLNLPFIRMLFQGVVLSPSEIAQSMPDILFTILSVGFRIVITYFPLKALGQILRILMEMEFNSRKVT